MGLLLIFRDLLKVNILGEAFQFFCLFNSFAKGTTPWQAKPRGSALAIH
jgi:hypothetical protein